MVTEQGGWAVEHFYIQWKASFYKILNFAYYSCEWKCQINLFFFTNMSILIHSVPWFLIPASPSPGIRATPVGISQEGKRTNYFFSLCLSIQELRNSGQNVKEQTIPLLSEVFLATYNREQARSIILICRNSIGQNFYHDKEKGWHWSPVLIPHHGMILTVEFLKAEGPSAWCS